MLFHYWRIIYRNWARYKSSFLINIIGLSTGLACTLLIYLWVGDELNFDKFHANDARLYQVMQNQKNGDNIMTSESTPGVLAEALQAELPEVSLAATSFDAAMLGKADLAEGEKHVKANCLYASKQYFQIFSYNIVLGDASQVLTDKSSIVLSRDLAIKIFGSADNVLGKTVSFQNERELQVTGVFEGTPANSSTQFDFVVSFEILKEKFPNFNDWGSSGPSTYVVLREDVDATSTSEKIKDIIKNKVKDTDRTLFLKPYSQKYLYGRYENGVLDGGRIEYVKLFSIIAVFILFIACINFMNLSTAKASRRVKEVGIKKAIGAQRRSLVFQYLSESMFISFLSLIIAIVLVWLVLPQFNTITGKSLSLQFDGTLVLSALGITIFTGLVAGSYPALYLSGFNPALILKGKFISSVAELWIRKGLVAFQFALSVMLIVAVLVVHSQIKFIQNKNLGYEKDNVIYFDMEGKVKESLETFLQEMQRIPGVVNASSTGFSIVGSYNATEGVGWEGKDPKDNTSFEVQFVNYDLLETLGIKVKEGRSFSRDIKSDENAVVLNEAAAKVIGYKDPLGKTVNLWGRQLQVVGIVNNFHFESLHKNISPLLFVVITEFNLKIMAKIEAGDQQRTLQAIAAFYESYNPGYPFDYKFLNDDYQAQYVAENRVSVLSRYFAGLAIIISCLGLFGLATFTAERRMKEIAIRKVLGASVLRIMYLLSVDFTKIVLVSIFVALPLSYIGVRYWLDSFVYRINLETWYFTIAAFTALFITWLIVGMQAFKVTRVNLAQTLRIND